MEDKIKVLVVDDHDVVRDGLAVILNAQPDIEVTGNANCGREAIFQFQENKPDVVVSDLQIPDMQGDEIVRQIRNIDSGANILIYSNYDLEDQVRRCLEAGARGYVLKDLPRESLVEAIRTVNRGDQYVPPEVAGKVSLSLQRERMTSRELEVLGLLVNGKGNREISDDLFVAEATVKTHLNNIMAKLKVSTRTEAVTVALRRGIVKLEA